MRVSDGLQSLWDEFDHFTEYQTYGILPNKKVCDWCECYCRITGMIHVQRGLWELRCVTQA